MTKLKILKIGDPLLKKRAKSVSRITTKHQKLIKDMIETMIEAPGIGLAAPQVGVSERIIVLLIDENPVCVVNPKITKRSGKQVCNEGCLSVPGAEAPVERYEQIKVTGLDKKGESVSYEVKDVNAVIFQHEIDHLDGIIFVDRVKDPSTIIYKDKKDPQ